MARTLMLSLGSTTLDLTDLTTGLIVSSFNPGAPAVREVADDLPGQDGTDDQTQYLGARVVSMTGSCVAGSSGSRSKSFKLLVPFLAPSARPTLTYSLDDDDVVKTVTLRASQWSAPPEGDAHLPFQVQWKGDPVALATTTNQVNRTPFSNTNGRSYPRAYNLVYPPLAAGGAGHGAVFAIFNNGDYQTWPTFRVYGPVTAPTISVNGVLLVFPALTIVTGDYIEVNTKARTVLLNGVAGASRYSYLDFTQSDWAPLTPGSNQVTISATSASSPALMSTLWQDAYLQ